MSKYSAHPVLQIKKREAEQRSFSNVTQGPEQAMLPHTPARVRRDHDSLTIGAKPFISFLVWPVFSN